MGAKHAQREGNSSLQSSFTLIYCSLPCFNLGFVFLHISTVKRIGFSPFFFILFHSSIPLNSHGKVFPETPVRSKAKLKARTTRSANWSRTSGMDLGPRMWSRSSRRTWRCKKASKDLKFGSFLRGGFFLS